MLRKPLIIISMFMLGSSNGQYQLGAEGDNAEDFALDHIGGVGYKSKKHNSILLSRNSDNGGIVAEDLVPAPQHNQTNEIVVEKTWELVRRMAQGDFDNLNALFDGLVFSLPDTSSQEDFGAIFGSVMFQIQNLKCTNLAIDDIKVSHSLKTAQRISFILEITGVTLDCNFNWIHDYGPGASGRGTLRTSNNGLSTNIVFLSDDYRLYPPYKANFASCNANINIVDINFDGGLTGLIADVLSFAYVNGLENSVKQTMCDEMVSLASIIDKSILKMSSTVESYHVKIPEEDADPLFDENNLITPKRITLLDWTEKNNQIGNWYKQGLISISRYLGTMQNDPNNSNDSDLGINIYSRDKFLDSNGLLTRSPAELGLENDGIIFRDEESSNASVKMTNCIIKGLDSISLFDDFSIISPYTIQTFLKWDSIHVKIKLAVDFDPSPGNPKILDSDPPPLNEHVTISIKITDVMIRLSFLTAMDQDELFNIPFGSVLETGQFFQCILSSRVSIKASQVEYLDGLYHKPKVEGFIGGGVDRFLIDTAEAFHSIYIGSIIEAIPTYFATSVKSQLNEIIDDYLSERSNIDCPRYVGQFEDTVDFRDLFFEPERALRAGATGTSPYGNRSSQVKLIVDETFAKPGAVNNLLNPFLVDQSGQNGTLFFPGDFLNFESNGITFKVYDPRLDNLDTIGVPDEFLIPGEDSTHLRNQFSIGDSKPVHASAKISIDFESNGQNELEIDLGLSAADIFFKIFMKMEKLALLQFPILDLANINCWLATTPPLLLEKNGFRPVDSVPNFSVKDFIFAYVRKMNLNIECVECSTPGIIELPRMMKLLKSNGVIRYMLSKLLSFIEEIINGAYIQTHLDRFVDKAKMRCPHHSSFGESSEVLDQYVAPKLPAFSRNSLEFCLMSAGIFAELTLAVVAINIDASTSASEPLSGEATLEALNVDFNKLVDFNEYNGLVRSLVNSFLQSIVDDSTSNGKDLKINNLVRSFLLDDAEFYSFQVNEVSIPIAPGVEFDLTSIRIYGLDSFTTTNVYNVIAQHTLQNHFELQEVSIEFVFFVNEFTSDRQSQNVYAESDEKKEMKVIATMKNVGFTFSLMLALDKEKTNDIQLGSLLETSTALPCIFSNTYAANITEVELVPGELMKTKITGQLSDEAKNIVSSSADLIFNEYLPYITSAMQITIENMMNSALEEYIIKSKIMKCREVDLTSTFVDLRDLLLRPENAAKAGGLGTMPYGDSFFKIRESIIDNYLSSNDFGSPKINDVFIKPFEDEYTNSEDITIIPGDVFEMDLDDEYGIRVTNVRLDNIGSITYPLQFFQPKNEEAFIVDNELSMGTEGKIIKIWAKVYITHDVEGVSEMNEVDVSVQLNSASIFLSTFVKIDERALKELQLRDINDVNCWIALIPPPALNEFGLYEDPTLSVNSFTLSHDDLNVQTDCISCPSADVGSLSTLGMIFNNPQTLNRFIDRLITGPALQEKINELQHKSTLNCGIRTGTIESSTVNTNVQQSGHIDDSYKSATTYFVLILLTIVISSSISLFVRYFTLQQHKSWLLCLEEDEIISLYEKQVNQENETKIQCERSSSMINSVPGVISVLFIALISFSLTFFLVSHLFVIGFVEIKGHMSTQNIDVRSFYRFSVISFAYDLWAAGSKMLAFFMFLSVVTCAYVKQVALLLIWFIPPSVITISQRGSIIQRLEGLGKWSMMSNFILVIYFTSLRISVASPVDLPKDFYSIELKVIPSGLVFGAFVLAQTVSHFCSFLSMHYHEKIAAQAEGNVKEESRTQENHFEKIDLNEFDPSDSLCGHAFKLRGLDVGQSMKIKRHVNIVVLAVAMVLITLLVIGFILPSLNIKMLGLLGLAYEASNEFEDAVTSHSLLSVIRLLIRDIIPAQNSPQVAGIVCLTILVLFSSILVPLLIAITLLSIWFLPMRQRLRIRLMKAIEILKPWEYLQVFIISLILASWQLDGISAAMLDDEYCSSIRGAFFSLYYYDVVGNANIDECLYNKIQVGHSTIALIASSILLSWLSYFVTESAAQKHRDDSFIPEYKERHNVASDDIDIPSIRKLIKLNPPTQFTDRFICFLRTNGTSISSSPLHSNDEQSECSDDDAILDENQLSTDMPSWASSWAPKHINETVEYKADEHFM